MDTRENRLDLIADLVAKARTAGADAADALFVSSTALSHAQRLGKPEHIEREESTDLGLRVFVGRQQAVVSSSDTSAPALDELMERALAMARTVPEDPFCGLAEPDAVAAEAADLDICDPDEPSTETLIDWATRAEDAARGVPGITNSEGAQASFTRASIALAASNGFAQAYERTYFGIGASVLAGEGTGMERDYDFTSAVHAADLGSPEEIGRSAGERAVKRLNPRRAQSAQVPVIYEPRAARSLIGHLAAAINGAAVARGTTFLKDHLGQPLFAESVRILDDPLRRRGLRSRPFDAEGIAPRTRAIVDGGTLATWILDLRSARQLGLASTGHASRGASSPPAPATTNLYLEPGAVDPATLMADLRSGFYVTELIGHGINTVTGDYSRGAAGFWIEDGQLSHPVSEVTVAGNLKNMFAHLTAADDLEFRYGTDAPTVRVDGMTVAGT